MDFTLKTFKQCSKRVLAPISGPNYFATASLLQKLVKIVQLVFSNLNKYYNIITKHALITSKFEGEEKYSTMLQKTPEKPSLIDFNNTILLYMVYQNITIKNPNNPQKKSNFFHSL